MPPKKQKPNGFMVFTLEWKREHGRGMSISMSTNEAGKVWSNMDATARAPYNEKAKEERVMFSRSPADRLTCTGTLISQVEQERLDQEQKERIMKREIETTVNKSVKNDSLETHSYYFIMANYFTKTLKGGVYVPAEIAVSKFSLKEGVSRIYHNLINPGVNIYGHLYEAQQYSETTHQLPLPPNALGVKTLGSLYNDILKFIRDDNETAECPPIYTSQDCMHVVESVLDFLKADIGANDVNLKVYSIQYLFYIMKEATCEAGEIEKPSSFYITDAYFERDFFEFHIGIGCQYHEDIDKCKYCTKSYVTRWGYMFADYMCSDIALRLIPGRHCPVNTNLNGIVTPAPSICNETESFISLGTTATYGTNALASSKIYYDEQKNAGASKTYTMDFPALGGRNVGVGAKKKTLDGSSSQRQKSSRTVNESSDDEETVDYGDPNPWTLRSRNVPRKPENSHFEIKYTKNEENSDTDEFNSVASFGRGRGSFLNTSLNSTTVSSYGRGRFFRP